MSEGVNYRLGMLEGRLHAYEREEDLVKLVGGDKKTDSKNQVVKNNFGEDIKL